MLFHGIFFRLRNLNTRLNIFKLSARLSYRYQEINSHPHLFRNPRDSLLFVNTHKKPDGFPKNFLINNREMSSKKDFTADKENYLKMPIEEKRKLYKCGSGYLTLDQIPSWDEYAKIKGILTGSNEINKKVSLFEGDITSLEIDSIVNAANNRLLGGGGVDGAIHRAAGSELKAECATLNGCETGNAKITGGYRLPAKYVIHTVGPIGEKPDKLASCYQTSLNLVKENNLRSVAFPCISTGVYGYPNEKAAHVAIDVVRKWLNENANSIDRIIFCLFLKEDVKIYHRLMAEYFPA
ncbi:uncharacterized protein LOC111618913 [Centruroides sculpturatus]|uniref:uncharacterized protein LOC111618913 n=1 Tax=Centruroides sculpturatus TaxID=218467 RepID=UPI000C6CC4D5|nr:uncharacterized protein LOC111618913 [Centruroides sculpturatus]